MQIFERGRLSRRKRYATRILGYANYADTGYWMGVSDNAAFLRGVPIGIAPLASGRFEESFEGPDVTIEAFSLAASTP